MAQLRQDWDASKRYGGGSSSAASAAADSSAGGGGVTPGGGCPNRCGLRGKTGRPDSLKSHGLHSGLGKQGRSG